MLRWIILKALELYQAHLRVFIFSSCRFSPSCSEYARQAILKYGIKKGMLMAARRVLSCHPLSSRSGYDPVI
ncbi:MAG: membrane protein insertion efficiency factor YidD [Candidatus Omnitrophica bacterium]|nr:membrane protein insertion efficiency factor YidD [Candidatus Omnitrophota bacterium]